LIADRFFMTVFDLIVLALCGASLVAGALRGLVRALLTGVALIAGLIIAARGYAAAGAVLRALGLVESNEAAHAAGFLALTGLIFGLGFVAGQFLSRRLRRARLAWFDRALGAGFGLLRGFFVSSVLYLALTAFPLRLSSVEEARTAPLLAEGAKLLTAFTSQDVRSGFLKQYYD
jgi:membrane protein required for colicin V production